MTTNYNTETVNVQFINQSFIDKIERGMVKEAADAMGTFVRQKLREDGFTRKVLPPVAITANELDRQITEEPTVIVEKEPDSVAANMPFLGRSEIRYWKTARYPVTCQKIASRTFKKSMAELATYRTDIRTVIQDNSVKDIQEIEDMGFYNNVVEVADANSNIFSIAGGFTKANLMAGVNNMANHKLPIGCILMTQAMYNEMLTWPATEVGSPAASDLFRGQGSLDVYFGHKIITTNKTNILPTNRAIVFAPPNYLGQFYTLKDATCFLKTEQDIIEMTLYEWVGVGMGNVNGAVVLDF
jgi:hypothetical protein